MVMPPALLLGVADPELTGMMGGTKEGVAMGLGV